MPGPVVKQHPVDLAEIDVVDVQVTIRIGIEILYCPGIIALGREAAGSLIGENPQAVIEIKLVLLGLGLGYRLFSGFGICHLP